MVDKEALWKKIVECKYGRGVNMWFPNEVNMSQCRCLEEYREGVGFG